jgi:hypothetical protein
MAGWVALALVALSLQAAPPAADRDEIVAVVQRFFDAIAKRDPLLARQAMTPDGQLVSVTEQDGKPIIRSRPTQQFIDSLAGGAGTSLERMWNPEVRIHGAIGTLWTRYDFHRNGTFSHCGVDAFHLVKTPDGWRITSAMYTIERANCPPSPLGPPK